MNKQPVYMDKNVSLFGQSGWSIFKRTDGEKTLLVNSYTNKYKISEM